MALAETPFSPQSLEFRVREQGKGPPLVFLHSGLAFHDDGEMLTALQGRFTVTAARHPGFGASPLPAWMSTVDDFAYVHLDLMDRLGLDEAVLVGCSLGAWVAAEMATKCPTRFKRLVLVSPLGVKFGSRDDLAVADVFAMTQDELHQRLYAQPSRWKIDPARTDADLQTLARNMETLALVTWEPYMHNPKLKQRLHRISCPTLLVRGEADGLVSDDYVKAYAALIPKSRTVTVAGAGHAVELEQPRALAERIAMFADVLEGAVS